MRHVFWVIPDRLAGRCGPGLEPWSLPALRSAGFRAVLNLSEYEPEHAELEAAGMDVAWVPLPNACPADDETEAACLRGLPLAADFLRSYLEAERTVLVHCALGRDRTGLLLAHHLASSAGLPPEEAIARVREACPKALSAPGWGAMAVRVIERLAGGA